MGFPAGLVGWWKLENGFNEVVGGKDFTVVGSPSIVPVQHNNGVHCDLVTEYFYIPDFNDGLNKDYGCIEFWVKFDNAYPPSPINISLFEFGAYTAGKINILCFAGGNLLYLVIYGGLIGTGQTTIVYIGGMSWNASEEHHLAFSWDKDNGLDGKRAEIYLDDVPSAIVQVNNDWSGNSLPSPLPMYLGRAPGSIYTAKSAIDNLKLWDYTKTDFSDRFTEGFPVVGRLPGVNRFNRVEGLLV